MKYEQAALHILEAGKRLYERGFAYANDGNISARLEDGTVLMTPTGVSKGFMTADMLITVDLSGKKLRGEMPPSSEMALHLRAYRENERIMSVVHAHPPMATSFASAGIPLDTAVLQEAVVQLGVVPLARYALPGSSEVGTSIAELCREYNAALLEYHGAVTWGENVMQALFRMESVEYYATVLKYLREMNALRPMTEAQIDGLVALREKWGVTGGGRPRGR